MLQIYLLFSYGMEWFITFAINIWVDISIFSLLSYMRATCLMEENRKTEMIENI